MRPSKRNGSDSFIYSRRQDLRFSCLRGCFIGLLSGSLKTKDLHNNTPFSQLESQVGILWHPHAHMVFELNVFSPTGCTTWSCTSHEPRVISSITDARNDCSCYVSESSYDWPICAFPTGSYDTKCVFAMFLSKERVITFKI